MGDRVNRLDDNNYVVLNLKEVVVPNVKDEEEEDEEDIPSINCPKLFFKIFTSVMLVCNLVSSITTNMDINGVSTIHTFSLC